MRLIIISFLILLLNVNAIAGADPDDRFYEETLWAQIDCKFLGDNYTVATIYKEDIKIELDGNILPADSTIFNALVEQLDSAIERNDVKLVKYSGEYDL